MNLARCGGRTRSRIKVGPLGGSEEDLVHIFGIEVPISCITWGSIASGQFPVQNVSLWQHLLKAERLFKEKAVTCTRHVIYEKIKT